MGWATIVLSDLPKWRTGVGLRSELVYTKASSQCHLMKDDPCPGKLMTVATRMRNRCCHWPSL